MSVAQIESLVPKQGSQTLDARLRHSAILTLPRRIGLTTLILLAATEFTLRGPVRSFYATDLNDFVAPYIQTRLLLKGLDPYSPKNLVRHWPEGARRPEFLIK